MSRAFNTQAAFVPKLPPADEPFHQEEDMIIIGATCASGKINGQILQSYFQKVLTKQLDRASILRGWVV